MRTTYFSNGLDPICRSMWSNVFSSSSSAGLLEIVRRTGGDVPTIEAEFAIGHACVWLGCNKVAHGGIAGA